jgi:hypothetical protein
MELLGPRNNGFPSARNSLLDKGSVPRIFSSVLDPNFHGSFSVGHCPGNCLFHWVFWELAPFFEDS